MRREKLAVLHTATGAISSVILVMVDEDNNKSSTLRLSFIDSVLFPFNYSFVDQATRTYKVLREVSACRFVIDHGSDNGNNRKDSDNQNDNSTDNDNHSYEQLGPSSSSYYRLKLIGDSGEIFHARLMLWVEKEEDGSSHANSRKSSGNAKEQQLRFNITLDRQVPLILSGYNTGYISDEDGYNTVEYNSTTLSMAKVEKEVDAEGCEVFEDKFPGMLLISSEQPLALQWFDSETGWAVVAPDVSSPPIDNSDQESWAKQQQNLLPSYHVPAYIVNRTRPNKGFEAVTAWSSPRMPSSITRPRSEGDIISSYSKNNNNNRPENNVTISSYAFWADSYVLTTTEGHLQDDPPGFHRWLLWKTDEGGDPILEMGHISSRWKNVDGDPSEFLSINDMTYWPEQELLLVLERGYDGDTNMVKLSTVDLTFPMSRRSHSLMNWTRDSMFLSPRGTAPIKLEVDNYESICLLPRNANMDKSDERLALLVNDDNHNPAQIGTQFVLLRLQVVTEGNGSGACQTTNAARLINLLILVVLVVVLLAGGIFWWGRYRIQGALRNNRVHYQLTGRGSSEGGEHGDGQCHHHQGDDKEEIA